MLECFGMTIELAEHRAEIYMRICEGDFGFVETQFDRQCVQQIIQSCPQLIPSSVVACHIIKANCSHFIRIVL